jgi:hypothetical protein
VTCAPPHGTILYNIRPNFPSTKPVPRAWANCWLVHLHSIVRSDPGQSCQQHMELPCYGVEAGGTRGSASTESFVLAPSPPESNPPLAGNQPPFAEKSATSRIPPLILTPWNVTQTWREMIA